jgi:hypothetical protein
MSTQKLLYPMPMRMSHLYGLTKTGKQEKKKNWKNHVLGKYICLIEAKGGNNENDNGSGVVFWDVDRSIRRIGRLR